ncbi:DNA repair protein SWI5-like protein [Trichoplax sp. H2]|nr:DNA repair protein SWI5-like protein [Trichoplax sp. H2]|eukprot:RDD38712.1 DNA repair protein SWI5-like protein [Trichoplax sp. H2]
MEYDTDTIYTKVQTFCQNMQTPRTLEELMKDIHCYDENLLQDCIKRLPSTNGIHLYQLSSKDDNTIHMIWKIFSSEKTKQDMACTSPRPSTPQQRLPTTPGSARKRTIATPDKSVLLKQYNDLQARLVSLDNDIAKLDTHYNEEDLALFIDKLHQYNEIKDIGQILLGKLAEVEGVLVKDLYDRFGLDMED